ncbi:MAG: TetR/AcrR family transcriptional regulator [Actinomycetota bacterium]
MGETETRRPRGRPREFDEETALDQLTELFWEQGFARTSVADLVEATGVHKPSLYRTFGSKEDVFARCLHRYLDRRMATMRDLIASSGPGIEGIEAFLDALLDEVLSGAASKGCLLVASSAELRGSTPGFEDFGATYRAALRERATELVAKAGGTPAEIEVRAGIVVIWMLGLDVSVRGGAQRAEAWAAVDALKAVVATWA